MVQPGDVQYHSNSIHDFYIDNGFAVRINSSGNVGIGTTSPGAKLHVQGTSFFFDQAIFDDKVGIGTTTPSSKLQVAGGIQMADDTDTASAAKVGTLKYRVSGNNSYVDMCMQTGAATYEWVNIVQNNW